MNFLFHIFVFEIIIFFNVYILILTAAFVEDIAIAHWIHGINYTLLKVPILVLETIKYH